MMDLAPDHNAVGWFTALVAAVASFLGVRKVSDIDERAKETSLQLDGMHHRVSVLESSSVDRATLSLTIKGLTDTMNRGFDQLNARQDQILGHLLGTKKK